MLSRLATAQAVEARCLEETRMLMVALAEAEAAEAVANAAPVGVPVAASSATVVAGVLVDAGELQDDASDDDIQRCIRVGEPLVRVLQRPPGSCERWCEQNVERRRWF